MLSEQEERALRSLPKFKKALKKIKKADKQAARQAELDRATRRNLDGTWRHDDPSANILREDGLWGKSAQAADGDWYSSH